MDHVPAAAEVGLDGHPIVETALVELYRETGHAPYLELASQFVEQRGHGLIGDSGFGRRYLQDHEPVREIDDRGAGTWSARCTWRPGSWTSPPRPATPSCWHASVARWDDMVAAKTYLTGGNGSRHEGESFGDRFELPPDRAYNETCAAIASFQWSWRLLLATGDGQYADLMERVLYNGFAGAIATDGTRFFYVNPLQRRDRITSRRTTRAGAASGSPAPAARRTSCAWSPRCSTTWPRSARATPCTCTSSAGAELAAPLAGGELAIRRWSPATRGPARSTMQVTGAPPQACGLALRVPAWCAPARIFC